ncbi:hypothetical protein [Terricaulis sp.]|uniref:hypothetical protein n=1 Tax=Terricaulis sp. TaxID=2768686 RepID=UPI002AC56780|nr:hypothetical protein [Terricaulis sp.]MDZ4693296.1 hypothetical protein [Terricaulis sp.]
MSRLFLKIAAFAAALLAAPLAAAQTISTPLQVRTGDVFTVNVDYTQSADIGGQEMNATMAYVYSIHVLDAEQRLWRFMPVSVSYQLPEAPGIDPAAANVNWPVMSDMMSAMMRMATDVGFDCRVDEYGRCLDMTNWPLWSARLENMALAFDAGARMFPGNRSTADIAVEEDGAPKRGDVGGMSAAPNWETLRGPVMAGVARMIDSFDSRDAASSMGSVYLPAYVQGRTLTRRETVQVVDEYEMPFGAPALRYTGTLRLDSIDRRANTATITRRSQLDEASARAAIDAMTAFVSETLIEPLAPHFPEGQTPPDGTALAQAINSLLVDFDYEDTTRGVVDLTTGMARETVTDNTMTARITSSDQPMTTRGRIITRVTPAAPNLPRLPRP